MGRVQKFPDPADPRRTVAGWEAEADRLEQTTTGRPLVLLVGSLYGLPRDWMGVEEMCFLPYDDPVLFEEIISQLADFPIPGHRIPPDCSLDAFRSYLDEYRNVFGVQVEGIPGGRRPRSVICG